MRSAILAVDGVLSLHELHIWQLSESKIVASVHVMASRTHDFMPVAAKIRKALHLRGIHSSTIQPEYHQARAQREDHLEVGFVHISDDIQYLWTHRRQRRLLVSLLVLKIKSAILLKMHAVVSLLYSQPSISQLFRIQPHPLKRFNSLFQL